jgi:hypothetical protein
MLLHPGCWGGAAADGVSWATDGSVFLAAVVDLLATGPRLPIAIAPFAAPTAESGSQAMLWLINSNLQVDASFNLVQYSWRLASCRESQGVPLYSCQDPPTNAFTSYPGICKAPRDGQCALPWCWCNEHC